MVMAFFVQLCGLDGIDLTFMEINLESRTVPADFTFKTCNFQEQLQVVALSGFGVWSFFLCGLIFLFDKLATS